MTDGFRFFSAGLFTGSCGFLSCRQHLAGSPGKPGKYWFWRHQGYWPASYLCFYLCIWKTKWIKREDWHWVCPILCSLALDMRAEP